MRLMVYFILCQIPILLFFYVRMLRVKSHKERKEGKANYTISGSLARWGKIVFGIGVLGAEMLSMLEVGLLYQTGLRMSDDKVIFLLCLLMKIFLCYTIMSYYSVWKMHIEGEKIWIRTIWGVSHTYEFSDITSARITSKGDIKLYKGNRLAARIDESFEGSYKLEKSLKKSGTKVIKNSTSKFTEGLKGGSDKVDAEALPQLKIIRWIVKLWYLLFISLGISVLLQIEKGALIMWLVSVIALIPIAGFIIYICFPKVTTLRDAPVREAASQTNKIHLLVPVGVCVAILVFVTIRSIKLYTYARFFSIWLGMAVILIALFFIFTREWKYYKSTAVWFVLMWLILYSPIFILCMDRIHTKAYYEEDAEVIELEADQIDNREEYYVRIRMKSGKEVLFKEVDEQKYMLIESSNQAKVVRVKGCFGLENLELK